jgi:hypothetical protein
VTGGWSKLHENIRNLYTSPNIIRMMKVRRMRWAGHVARMREMRNLLIILVGKYEGKSPLGRTRCKWKYNILMELREINWEVVDLIHLAQDQDRWRALVNTVMNLRVL